MPGGKPACGDRSCPAISNSHASAAIAWKNREYKPTTKQRQVMHDAGFAAGD
jgi:hypothetical protein